MKIKNIILLLGCIFPLTLSGQNISREQMIQNAIPYYTHRWSVQDSSTNITTTARGENNKPIETPAWVNKSWIGGKGTTLVSLPYGWACWDTPSTFDYGLKNKKWAGDVNTTTISGEPRRVAGIDCSGLVARSWGLGLQGDPDPDSLYKKPYSTFYFADNNNTVAYEKPKFLKQGDILVKGGIHVMLVLDNIDGRNITVMEAVTGHYYEGEKNNVDRVRVKTHDITQLTSEYQYRSYIIDPPQSVYGQMGTDFMLFEWENVGEKYQNAVNYEIQISCHNNWKPEKGFESSIINQNVSDPKFRWDSSSNPPLKKGIYWYSVRATIHNKHSLFTYPQMCYVDDTPPLCGIPKNLMATGITNQLAHISWTFVIENKGYFLRYRKVFDLIWNEKFANNSLDNLTDLMPDTKYEVQIATICKKGNCNNYEYNILSEWSSSLFFQTKKPGTGCYMRKEGTEYTPCNNGQDEASGCIYSDRDCDGIPDDEDNCPDYYNPTQDNRNCFDDKPKPCEPENLIVEINGENVLERPCGGTITNTTLTAMPKTVTVSNNENGNCIRNTISSEASNLLYLWNTGATTQSIQVNYEGTFSVTITDLGSTDNVKPSAYASISVSVMHVPCSYDPNEISGPIGYAESQMVAQKDKMPYTIRYENDPDFASAPATRVKITCPVSDKQNINSFRLSDFGFGSFVFTVPQNTTNYYKRLDVADSLGVWVDVTAGIDVVKRELFWIFQAIDPQTGVEPVNAQMGFLPVNNKETGNGEGYVNFTILPAANTQTGDIVLAEASIIFDENAAIGTNVWSNVIDAGNPQSSLTGVQIPSDSLAAQFTFSAQDDIGGSGVKQIEIYVSENEDAYTLYAISHPDSTLTFYGASGRIYHFFSIAEDNVGNKEPVKTEAEFILNLNLPPTDILLSYNTFYENDYYSTVISSLTTIDDNPQNAHYTLVSGEGDTNNDLFGISVDRLMTGADFICKKDTIYNVRIRTTDIGGLWFEKTFELKMIKTYKEDTVKINQVICEGSSFDFNGKQLSDAGIYYDTLQMVLGCDSIIQLTLTVNPVTTTSVTASTCQDVPYHFGGRDLTVAGTYLDTLKSISGCDSIVILTLAVNPDPVVNLGGDRNVPLDETVTLDAGEGFKSYQWSTGANTQTITVENPGEDDMISIWVQVSSSDNCIGSDTILIIYQGSVDIDKNLAVNNQSIRVFPNPTSGKVNILFDHSEWREIALYDTSGKEIYRKKHDEKEVILDFSHLPGATYILKVDKKQFRMIIVH